MAIAEADPTASLLVPPQPRDALARPRLVADVTRRDRGDLGLLVAPAGFGKSTLLASLNAPSAPVSWLGLDARLWTADRFAHALADTLARHHRCVAEALPSLRHHDALLLGLGALHALAEGGADALLVIDDAQRLTAEARSLLADLCSRPVAGLAVRIASRDDLGLPVARWQADGRLRVWDADALRFDADETSALLGASVDPVASARTHRLLGGWPAGVGLVRSALARGSSLPSDTLKRYVETELLDPIDPGLAGCLARVADVDQLDDAALAALLGDEAVAAREALTRRGLLALDADGRRSMSPLLREAVLLRRARSSALDAACVTAAVDALDALGRDEEALALAHSRQRYDLAAALLRRLSIRWTVAGEHAAQLAAMERFPSAERARHPTVAVEHAWTLANLGRFAHARSALDAAKGALDARAYSLRASLAAEAGDLRAAEEALDACHDPTPTDDVVVRALRVDLALGRGDTSGAFAAVAALEESCADAPGLIRYWGHYKRLNALLTAGDGAGAGALADRLLRTAVTLGAGGSNLAVMHLSVAAAALLRADLAVATSNLEAALDLLDPSADPLHGWVLAALDLRLAALAGYPPVELDARLRSALARIEASAGERLARRLLLHGGLTLLSVTATSDGVGRAWARQLRDLGRPEAPRFGPHPMFPAATTAAAVALAEHVLGRSDRALALIDESMAGDVLPLDRALLATVLARVRHETGRDARPALALAVEAAAPAGFVEPFALMPRSLIEATQTLAAELGHGPLLLALSVKPAPSMSAEPTAPPLLSPREREVLALVARGMTNAEVCRALFIAPATVKNHLENIYRRLEVGRRTQAVAKARSLGLLVE